MKKPQPCINQNSEAIGSLKNRKWLKAKDAAEYLGISVEAVRQLGYRGRLNTYSLGKAIYFSREEIDRCLATSNRGVNA